VLNQTTQIAPPSPGVHVDEAALPVAPPPGAVGFKIVDFQGNVICYAWVAGEYRAAAALEAAWGWWDQAVHPIPGPVVDRPPLRLIHP
jgi:hypothetical protein